MGASSQGVDADGGLVLVILAPINQDLAGSERFLHVADDEFGVLTFEAAGEFVREGLGVVVADSRVERNINLQTLGARSFGEATQSKTGKCVVYP